MNDKQIKDRSDVASYILSYLVENPDAEDSLEGIAEWWLLQQSIKFEERRVKQALAELVEKGLVEEILGPDQRKHYRINSSKTPEIQSYLEEKS